MSMTCCYIPSIEAALETKFTRESGSADGQSPCHSDETLDFLLLDKSKLQFQVIGLLTAYFIPQGRDGYTMTGSVQLREQTPSFRPA